MPLDGIRVLDWTIWQQGPVATMMLADMGAEVIKVEHRVGGDPARGIMKIMGATVGTGDGRNYYFENNNRNKKGITLDLSSEKGREVALRLVAKSDVFVQNFRQGVAARLGLDYPALSKINPQLIYANGTGFGVRGPDSEAPSFDMLGQARSGLMSVAQEPGLPPHYIVGGISDQIAAIMLAYGITLAIIARAKHGVGQELNVSLLGSMVWLQNMNVASVLSCGADYVPHCRTRAGNPLWNYYKCADDRWLCLGMLQGDRYWPSFCQALGLPDIENDPRFDTSENRHRNCEELITMLDVEFSRKTRAEWTDILQRSEMIFTPVNAIADLVGDRQVLANDYITAFDHPSFGRERVVGVPVELNKTPGTIRDPAPEFGQHTEEVLLDVCGYTWDEIEVMRDQGVI